MAKVTFGGNGNNNDDETPDDGGYRFPEPQDRGIAAFYFEQEEMKQIAQADQQELSHLFN